MASESVPTRVLWEEFLRIPETLLDYLGLKKVILAWMQRSHDLGYRIPLVELLQVWLAAGGVR